MSIVRVNGRRQVYIPVYRQAGASTLDVVGSLKEQLPDIKSRLTYDDIDLKLVMDQSVYVRNSIVSLLEEGVLGAILCSLDSRLAGMTRVESCVCFGRIAAVPSSASDPYCQRNRPRLERPAHEPAGFADLKPSARIDSQIGISREHAEEYVGVDPEMPLGRGEQELLRLAK